MENEIHPEPEFWGDPECKFTSGSFVVGLTTKPGEITDPKIWADAGIVTLDADYNPYPHLWAITPDGFITPLVITRITPKLYRAATEDEIKSLSARMAPAIERTRQRFKNGGEKTVPAIWEMFENYVVSALVTNS